MDKHRMWDVLVVDDDQSICEIAAGYLEDRCQVRRAHSGPEAMALVEESPPQIVFSDLVMPDKDGFWLLEKLRTSFPDIPVIIVTGFGNAENAITALRLGAFDLLIKPFEKQSLDTFLDRVVAHLEFKEELQDAKAKSLDVDKLSSIGLISATISHDILNPMTIIMGNTRLLLKGLEKGSVDNEKTKAFLERIQAAGTRVTAICQNLSNMSKSLEEERYEPTPLSNIIWDVTTICKPLLNNQGIDFRVSPAPAHIILNCSRLDISLSLLAIVQNALEAVSDSKEKSVKVSFADNQNILEIKVTNTGQKIPDEIQKNMFNSGFTSHDKSRAGMGLTIAKRYIEGHNGEITCQSDQYETIFTIHLPRG